MGTDIDTIFKMLSWNSSEKELGNCETRGARS